MGSLGRHATFQAHGGEEEILNELRGDMFKTFARVEYALKAAGFHKGDGPAEPDWSEFANSLSHIFDNPPTRTSKPLSTTS
jgi:hypothetical protein